MYFPTSSLERCRFAQTHVLGISKCLEFQENIWAKQRLSKYDITKRGICDPQWSPSFLRRMKSKRLHGLGMWLG